MITTSEQKGSQAPDPLQSDVGRPESPQENASNASQSASGNTRNSNDGKQFDGGNE